VVLLSDENGEEEGEDLLPLLVRDVMVREVVTVDEDASVKEAVDIMNKFQIGSLIVLEKGKAKGIITERDLLRRVIAEARDVMSTKVKEIMTTPLVVVGPTTDLEEAVKLMFQSKIKKLAVVDANKLVGIVTLTDIARVEPQMIRMLKQLGGKQETPKSMQKVIDYYIIQEKRALSLALSCCDLFNFQNSRFYTLFQRARRCFIHYYFSVMLV